MPPELKEDKSDPLAGCPGIEQRLHKGPKLLPAHQTFGQPSFLNRLYLSGVPCKPIDIVFMLHGLFACIWTVICLIFVDIPFLFWTRFTINSERHPTSWGAIYSFCMAVSRASSSSVYNVAQLRMVSNTIALFVPLRMLHLSHYKVQPDVRFKVHLDTLLIPERRTLFETRTRLGLEAQSPRGNPLIPSHEYLESFLSGKDKLANLPEESGALDSDGTYTLKGEWIEALDDPKLSKKGGARRSNVVLLYAHGGGHVFCSAKFHRQLVTRMLLEFGPGARAFVMEYRLAPEDPFPAAVHDVYAAYLYLTQPNHEAITLLDSGVKGKHHSAPIDPMNIVLAGDSAGAGLAIAFQLYMRDYVCPSVEPKPEMPPVTVLLSAWTDISTSMPSATNRRSFCYIPSPMGVNPFVDKETFLAFPKVFHKSQTLHV
ncbi:alpha/beta hydrolase fold-domain-containing protein [Mortierella sp. GBAus27b]|nr:alpha/beta hydrolase fold-domain-containing protein [Mortierella sp. GBAus27b]